jgi:hypothetical protein
MASAATSADYAFKRAYLLAQITRYSIAASICLFAQPVGVALYLWFTNDLNQFLPVVVVFTALHFAASVLLFVLLFGIRRNAIVCAILSIVASCCLLPFHVVNLLGGFTRPFYRGFSVPDLLWTSASAGIVVSLLALVTGLIRALSLRRPANVSLPQPSVDESHGQNVFQRRNAAFFNLFSNPVLIPLATGQPVPQKAGDTASVQCWSDGGRVIVPAYSSRDEFVAHLGLGTSFLEGLLKPLLPNLPPSAHILLDPASDHPLLLPPEDLRKVFNLDGTGPFKPDTKVLQLANLWIGQPDSNYAELTESLAGYFKTRKEVLAAYLTLMHDRSSDGPPGFVVVLHTRDDAPPTFLKALGLDGTKIGPLGKPFEVMQMAASSRVLMWIRAKIPPFYTS